MKPIEPSGRASASFGCVHAEIAPPPFPSLPALLVSACVSDAVLYLPRMYSWFECVGCAVRCVRVGPVWRGYQPFVADPFRRAIRGDSVVAVAVFCWPCAGHARPPLRSLVWLLHHYMCFVSVVL